MNEEEKEKERCPVCKKILDWSRGGKFTQEGVEPYRSYHAVCYKMSHPDERKSR